MIANNVPLDINAMVQKGSNAKRGLMALMELAKLVLKDFIKVLMANPNVKSAATPSKCLHQKKWLA